jgi:hypothetical protein
VVLSILSHLAPKDLLCVALVNAFFASMCSDGFVWSAVYDRIWPLSLCFTSPWHRQSLTPPTPSPPALQSPASTSCTSTADHQSGRSSDTVGGDDPARLRDSGVSWKRVVQQRAQTERNWEEGTYRVVHEFSGKGDPSWLLFGDASMRNDDCDGWPMQRRRRCRTWR